MFFTLRAERLEPASTPEVRFMETASGTPAAIRTWWYPGERTGFEFIYPREQARRLAMAASQPVLTTDAQTTTTEQTNTDDLSRVASGGQETDVNASAAPTAATPTGTTQEGQIASSSLSISTPSIPALGSALPVTQTASTQATTSQSSSAQPTRTQLPRTATPLPLVAMVGTLALLSAATLWYWRTRLR
jgi:cobalamin biosynthesis Mg chelatase CobN